MNVMNVTRCSCPRAMLAVVAAILILASAAGADVKITFETNLQSAPPGGQTRMPERPQGTADTTNDAGSETAGQPPAGPPERTSAQPPGGNATRTMTALYRGQAARVEAGKDPVVIYDWDAGKVFTLDPEKQTYTVSSSRDALKQLASSTGTSAPGGKSQGKMSFDTTVKLEKTTDTKTIAGKTATKYLLKATARMSMSGSDFPSDGGSSRGGGFPGGGPPGGGFPGGGRPDGGGFPGGGGRPSGDSGGPSGGMPSMAIQGEYWLVDASLLPAGNKSPLVPLLRQTTSFGPVVDQLNKQLTKMKLVPLASKVTVTMERKDTDSNSDTNAKAKAGPQDSPPTIMEAKLIEDGPLDDTLFHVPVTYQKVKSSK